MAFSESDLTAIDRAIAAGVLEVEHNGRRVRYSSMSELMKARQMIEGAIAAQTGGSTARASYSVARVRR